MFTHIAPNQKNDTAYEKKSALNAQIASKVGADGFCSSNTRIVIMIARIASINADNRSLLIFTILYFFLVHISAKRRQAEYALRPLE